MSYFCLFSCILGKTWTRVFCILGKTWTRAFTVFFLQLSEINLQSWILLYLCFFKPTNAKYRSTLLNREVFSTLFAVQFWPQLWTWLLLTKTISDLDAGWQSAMKSPRRTISSRSGHLGGNHHSASLWADCVDSCDWAPTRNLQLLHHMGEPLSNPEALFLW